MGRKSAAKSLPRSSSDGTPPEEPKKSSGAVLIVGVIALVGLIGAFAYSRSAATEADAAAATAAQAAAQVPADGPPPAAKFGPHKQATLPPLPFQAYAPPRPADVVRADYVFAAEHPEVLSYVPCFCGCERSGHTGNDSCFVARRDSNGDVTEWEPHGLECTVCLDVASQARQMYSSGASVKDIRAAVEQKWAATSSQQHTHTPTPMPK